MIVYTNHKMETRVWYHLYESPTENSRKINDGYVTHNSVYSETFKEEQAQKGGKDSDSWS